MIDSDVAAAAPRNELPVERLRLRPDASGQIDVTPGVAGWRHLGFRVRRLEAERVEGIGDRDSETVVVNVAGGDVVLSGPELEAVVLPGRPTVFDGLPTAFYLPPGQAADVRSSGTPGAPATVAIATAPVRPGAPGRLGPVLIRREDMRVEIRGAGNASREIHHIVEPSFPADRLLLVEVLTPSGNWSSWPPHKHDVDDMPTEAVLEEVYHYRFRRPEAWAIQRLYRRPERGLPPRDALWAVRDGEVVLVTDGYHPFAATHGDDAWYLNALAGDRRTMACSFDPDLDAVREAWATMAPDPRLPFRRG